jgi:hypothetical protein
MNMGLNNGMMQRQHQMLEALCALHSGAVDILSLGAAPVAMRQWLLNAGLRARVLGGAYQLFARMNASAWYIGGVILCNKLRWTKRFRFPLLTPLPRAWIKRYNIVVCYYPWAHRLLALERAGRKTIIDMGDVMANRHERIGTRRWITMDARDEGAILESQSRCVAITEDDAAEFKRIYGVRLPVVSFAPPAHAELITLPPSIGPSRVGFMGAPSYLNEEILRVLAAPEFLNCIAKADIELVVAGGICDTADLRTIDALKGGGAHIVGRVNSTVDFYKEVAVVLNPIGPSTGVKVKSVETLIAGRLLITTRWGADSGLRHAFPEQIAFIEWPIDPRVLGNLTVSVVRGHHPIDKRAALDYAAHSKETLRRVLSP